MYRLLLIFLLSILVNHLSYADQAVSFDESLKQSQTTVIGQAEREINLSNEEASVQQQVTNHPVTKSDKAPTNTNQAPTQQTSTGTNNNNPWIRPNPWAETAKENPWANRPLPSSSTADTSSSLNANAASNSPGALPSPPNIFAPPSANSATQPSSSNK